MPRQAQTSVSCQLLAGLAAILRNVRSGGPGGQGLPVRAQSSLIIGCSSESAVPCPKQRGFEDQPSEVRAPCLSCRAFRGESVEVASSNAQDAWRWNCAKYFDQRANDLWGQRSAATWARTTALDGPLFLAYRKAASSNQSYAVFQGMTSASSALARSRP